MSAALLAQWRGLSSQWWQPNASAPHKELLGGAYDALGAAVHRIRENGDAPAEVDMLTLASEAFTYRHTRHHLLLGLELLDLALDTQLDPGVRFRDRCVRGRRQVTSRLVPGSVRAQVLVHARGCSLVLFQRRGRCEPRALPQRHRTAFPPRAAWTDTTLVTRQLPALRHSPMWDVDGLPWAPLLRQISSSFDAIR
eukprot:7388970-Prymnesium_polylepis.1